MKYGRNLWVLTLVLWILAAVPAALEAQSVEGRVTWSDGEAVVAAKTTLLDAGYGPVAEGETDAEGRYRLLAPDAGEYIVVVAAEGYASQMSDPISITAGGTMTLDVVLADQRVGQSQLAATDTMSDAALLATAIAESCQGAFLANFHGILFGIVRDEATGTPIPDATIDVNRDNPQAMTPGVSRLNTESGADGVYLICTAPAGEDLRLRGIAEGTEGDWTTERLPAGTMRRVDLQVPLYDPNQPGSIVGRVQDQDWGREIRGVEVTVKDTNLRVESDARGYFRIPELPWGEYTLAFEHPSYGQHEQTLRVIGGKSHDIEVHLPPEAIEMPAIIVRVRPRRWYGDMVNLQDRIDRGVGYI
ncbi:MAG: carboxypeptidase regulatory-like domain-containing protein, partial [Gemmatimonadetes bacterium]|nr:carboxypeptidase regulatory-like domain-containing protein [Gemmatimonadota bacterium]